MALADGPGLYGRVDPPVIWNNGTTPFTFEVVTTNANIASVTFIGVQEYAGLPMYDDGTHGDRVAGDGIFTLNNITCPPLPLRFGGAFLESPANAKVVATDGSSNFVQVSLGVVDIAQSIAAVKLADNIYATKYALFVVDPSFGPLSATTSEENSRGAGPFLKRATSALYSVLPDDFDLVAAMPGRDIYHSGDYGRPAGFFIGAAGQETVTGSRGRLKGILYHMFGEGLLLTHEFGHNWNAFAGRALGLTGCSQCSGPHWDPYSDIGGAMAAYVLDARALNGAGQLVDNGDGSWKLWRDPEHINGANAVYSKLDLYFMGLLPAAEVPPIHQLVNPDFTDINHVTATTVNTYSVSDITGGQAPPPSFPANFSTAFVIVNDREIAPAEFAFYSAVVRYYTGTSGPPSDVIPFYVATGGRATMNAVLPVSSAETPSLAIAKTHTDKFTQGQVGATYVVTVTNGVPAGPTSGTVTVTETMPAGLTLVSISGTGWNCAGNSCTRNDTLNPGLSYPTVAVTVNVDANAASLVTNQVSVSGGGSASANASDPTAILAPPAVPVLTYPSDGATGVTVAPTLVWSATAGAREYDVYFGTSASPPLVWSRMTGTSYRPDTLTAGRVYYWRVVAKNSDGSNTSLTWSFTTSVSPPAAPYLDAPPNGDIGLPGAVGLTWNASDGATSYDVYFGTAASPPLVTTTTRANYSTSTLTEGTTYYWRVVAKNAGGSNTSATWSFTTQAAPVLSAPANGATGVLVAPTLTWSASIGATSYDVYFGTAPSPPLVTSTTGTSHYPSTLTAGTTYYWRIAAKNSRGSNTSATWSFTTQAAPWTPVLSAPANGATGVLVAPTLTWSASIGATSYDVYFGTAPSPLLAMSTTGTSYSPWTLTEGTTYYWRVVAKNDGGSNASATWSFVTQAARPAAPVLSAPANGATGVLVAPTLMWSASMGATSYDVYFGTAASPLLVTSTAGTSYSPGTLKASTTYYWRIAAKNSGGSNTSSIWSFTTQVLRTGRARQTSPTNGAGGVLVAPTLVWNASSGATSYDVYFGTAASPPQVTSTAGTSYAPGTLSQQTTYYWRIVAQNSAGSGSSSTWEFTTGTPPVGLAFVPVPPCRVVDTRSPAGSLGAPAMTADTSRSFTIPRSACGIPNTAQAYSLNVTVVPQGLLSFLTLWPTGQNRPLVSTLNSFGGTVVANAAIVPAGTDGAVSVYVTDPTDVDFGHQRLFRHLHWPRLLLVLSGDTVPGS